MVPPPLPRVQYRSWRADLYDSESGAVRAHQFPDDVTLQGRGETAPWNAAHRVHDQVHLQHHNTL